MDGRIRQWLKLTRPDSINNCVANFPVEFKDTNYNVMSGGFTSNNVGWGSGVTIVSKAKKSCTMRIYLLDRSTALNTPIVMDFIFTNY